jgi:hypothetical protein
MAVAAATAAATAAAVQNDRLKHVFSATLVQVSSTVCSVF